MKRVTKGYNIREGQQAAGRIGPVPPRDTEITFIRSLLLHHGSVRIEESGQCLNLARSFAPLGFTQVDSRFAWNGQELRSLRDRHAAKYQKGAIDSRTTDLLMDLAYRPPFRALWPMISLYSPINLGGYRLAKERAQIGAHACAILKRLGRQAGHEDEIWIDLDRGFLILRTVGYWEGRLARQMDVEYEETAGFGWRPTRWTTSLVRADGTYDCVYTAEVTAFGVPAAPTPSDFTIDFPAGTWIYDKRQRDHAREYIVRPDNTWRLILDSERRHGATYEQLLNSETGGAFNQNQSATRRVVWGGGSIVGVVLAAVGCAAAWRRRRQR